MTSSLLAVLALAGAAQLGAQNAGETSRPVKRAPDRQKSPFEAVSEPKETAAKRVSGPVIEAIEFRGARRVTPSLLRAVIVSRTGGIYDIDTLRKDIEALQNTQRFSRVVMESEPGRAGSIVRFFLTERPLIATIEFEGDSAARIADVLERLQERKIRLGIDMLYDEDELPRALAAIEELLAEKGRSNLTVTASVEPGLADQQVRITFRATVRQ